MGGRTDGITQILRTICLICACHLMGFLICYHSHKLQTAQASFTGHSRRQHQTPCANAQPMSYLYHQPQPQTARSTVPRRQCVTSSHSFISRTHDRGHIVVPAGWDNWGKICVLRGGFDTEVQGEAWERDLSPDTGIDLNGGDAARKLHAFLVEDLGPKVRALSELVLFSSSKLTQPTPVRPLNNQTP